MGLGEITPVVLNRDMFEEEVFTIEDFTIWGAQDPAYLWPVRQQGAPRSDPCIKSQISFGWLRNVGDHEKPE